MKTQEVVGINELMSEIKIFERQARPKKEKKRKNPLILQIIGNLIKIQFMMAQGLRRRRRHKKPFMRGEKEENHFCYAEWGIK